MAKRKSTPKVNELVIAVVNGLLEKKGHTIKVLNFTDFPQAVCNYFVVCHGTSKIHVQALADSVEEVVRATTGIKQVKREGVQNAEWILLDYFDVVVHVFEEEKRDFYKLEQLWADAPILDAEDIVEIPKEPEDGRRKRTKQSS